jgi:anthranilate synthase/aminodeoxychorismate synthase-like glutamine amidotransferase
MNVLVLDNYDSFVFNLAQALRSLGAATQVERNDAITIEQVIARRPDAIVISPGPGRPEDPQYFGVCGAVLRELSDTIPVLGVCLGHQGVVHAFGGKIVNAPCVMHGKASAIDHDGTGLFEGLAQPMTAMRYHSLVADPETMPECLRVNARTTEGVVMAVEHRSAPVYGVQFHPESIGTPNGPRILANFLSLARVRAAR